MTRWALVPVKADCGDGIYTGYQFGKECEQRAAALLAVAKACDPLNFSSTVAQKDEAYDALRAVMPEFDKE